MKLQKTADYHEDDGDCLFFYFPSFEEPCEVYVGSPSEIDFDHEHWTHFTRDINFNSIITQAIYMARK